MQCEAITTRGVRCKLKAESCRYHNTTGAGLFSALKNVGSNFVNRRVGLALQGPRTGPTARFSKFLSTEAGSQPIKSIKIARKPIMPGVQKILNFLSFGKFSKTAAKLKYDSVYHNYLLIETTDGKKYKVEKNHIIEASNATENDYKNEHYDIPVHRNLNLKDMVQKASHRDKAFWQYDGKKDNCQKFTEEMLDDNGLLSPALDSKVREIAKPQDAKALIDSLGVFSPVPKLVTDTAASFDRAVYGDGVHFERLISGKGIGKLSVDSFFSLMNKAK